MFTVIDLSSRINECNISPVLAETKLIFSLADKMKQFTPWKFIEGVWVILVEIEERETRCS